MDLKTKHRIVGSVVVIACVAIFIPIFFHRDLPQDKILSLSSKIPAPPSEPVYQTTESGVKFSFDSAEVKEKAPELAAMVNTNKQPRPKPTVSESKPKLKAKTTIATTTTKTKTKTVVAEVKPALAIDAAPKAWVVQLGTFADKANVDRLVQKLRTAGYDAYERNIQSKQKQMVQVMVGPEIKKSKATQLQQQLQARFKLNGVVTNYKV